MKITGPNGLNAAAPRRKRESANGAGFANHLGQPESAQQAGGTSGAGSVAALLAVQAAGDALEGRRQTVDRAEAMLKRLDALRLALLEGRIDDDALKRLATDMERQSEMSGDPDLAELVAEIELRANVELAKRGLI